MQRTIEELTRAIYTVERCKVAYEETLGELDTPNINDEARNIIHEARTIIHMTLINLKRQRVLLLSLENVEDDRAQERHNDRFDIAEERAEENKLRQQREQAERRIEERQHYRGFHNR